MPIALSNGCSFGSIKTQVYYGIVDLPRNEGKDYFEINEQTGEIFTKVVFDREKQAAYALEVEAHDGAPSARPNSNGLPNSGRSFHFHSIVCFFCTRGHFIHFCTRKHTHWAVCLTYHGNLLLLWKVLIHIMEIYFYFRRYSYIHRLRTNVFFKSRFVK